MNTTINKTMPRPKTNRAERIQTGTILATGLLAKDHSSLSLDAIRERKKSGAIVAARTACIVMLRDAGLSYPEIGEALNIDHSTAILAMRRVRG